MSKFIRILSVCTLLLSLTFQTIAYTTQLSENVDSQRLYWNTKIVPIAFSTSLTEQNISLRPESDVLGAIQRSLETWEKVANIKFQVIWSDKKTVSPTGKSGDSLSLVTIAQTPENLMLFGGDADTVSARTRVFFNGKGFITEADIVLNPYEQFSTNGAFGTFDFEGTLTHEIGHLLGLEHSTVIGATMQEHQGRNGIYNLESFSSRTLAEDDISGIRALYGANPEEENCCGSVTGKLIQANGKPSRDFQVWAEEFDSGRVAAGVLTDAEGNYRIESLKSGQYKLYTQDIGKEAGKTFSVEMIGEVIVNKGKTQILSKKLKSETKDFDVNYIGFNGQVSQLAIPVNGGRSYMIYVGGKNLDSKNLSIVFSSPYITVTPRSLTDHKYGDDVSVISFEINVSEEILLGEYSFSVKAKNKNIESAVGSLTVETFVNSWNSNFLSTSNNQ